MPPWLNLPPYTAGKVACQMPAESPARLIDCHLHYMPSAIGDRLRSDFMGKNPQRHMVGARPAWRDLSLHLDLMDRHAVAMGVMLDYGSELMRGLKSLGGSLNEPYEAYNSSMSEDLAPLGGRLPSA